MNWVNNPIPNIKLDHNTDVFIGGVNGYNTYRIPSLVILPKGSKLANGEVLDSDLMLAIAEARRYAALDTGVIDLVLKTSRDEGVTWSKQQVICRNQKDEVIGKCGNATPVFDNVSGQIHLLHNLSGIQANRHHTAVVITSPDGGKTWSERELIDDNNLIFGPGHGIQKQLEPNRGRLIVPGYLHRADAPNQAIVIYSDDNGLNWNFSEPLSTGDESEVAELEDGSIYMTTRQHAQMGLAPAPNGRLWSTSKDGGHSWSDAKKDTNLKTPVCQASVLRINAQGGLAFSNPSDEKSRINMTIHYSPDNGKSWTNSTQVYMGPAGYSDLGKLTGAKTALLYENGSMSYSQKISIATMDDRILSGSAINNLIH